MTAHTEPRDFLDAVRFHRENLANALKFLEENLPREYKDPVDNGPVILSFDPLSLPANVTNITKALDYLENNYIPF
jgi:hypothetical protein